MASRRTLANLLIGAGAAFLLVAGGVLAYNRLTQRPTPTPTLQAEVIRSTATATASASSTSPMVTSTATRVAPPTGTWTPQPSSVGVSPTRKAMESPTRPVSTQTDMPATASPTVTKTATPSITTRPTQTPTAAIAPVTPLPPRLAIPSLDVNAHITEVTWRVLETNDGVFAQWDTAPVNEIGHHLNSVDPGEQGNCVLAGHSQDDAVLARLEEIKAGAEILITNANGQQIRYITQEIVRLAETGVSAAERLENARYLQDTDDARLTLITCWPSWAYTHRIIIIAILAPEQP